MKLMHECVPKHSRVYLSSNTLAYCPLWLKLPEAVDKYANVIYAWRIVSTQLTTRVIANHLLAIKFYIVFCCASFLL